ncbi:MAG: cell division protein FtsH [Candidatus Ryanbacteria bacterium CG10_big_fil_rev_8_21_14_0_10_43_42]|uniref:ATP-dependent zinc metalloprotease FtsH n=1 Tax=Candidatus Ryanbacteria bacterium CG10_big_fil_rev_8_21_14_0_10_43_42 TaxID=1974864 RepID=A0A2M8KY69_9BACT|nr:MAG: cell division protein FtsH [Candidatus Ryanbacteria bacterium CG10_big_fil_rev_8_21_14_0_10_43_42]
MKNPVTLFGKNILYAVLIFFILTAVYASFVTNEEPEEITLSRLVTEIKAGDVERITVQQDKLEITLVNEVVQTTKKESDAALTETLVNYGVSPALLESITIEVKEPSGLAFWAATVLPFLLPILLIGLFIWLTMRQVQRSNGQAMMFGQSRARVINPQDKKGDRVTFKDVAGSAEAKEELEEIVDFLKNPKKFLDIGARIPRGVLLMGSPGTGKTLLAKAVAGEAGVPFFHMSASEFVEMFVGVGASRVRDLFRTAKKTAPSIIFVDEIDAVGRHRGAGLGGGHDEREQTLNQILTEMDGFETSDQVIVMAATNRPDVLDPALLRPGRFDRRVVLDLPDIKDREAILAVHVIKKHMAGDIDLRRIAERTPGFSGADLANLVNEAAIAAARENRKEVNQMDVLTSIEKVLLGPERKSKVFSDKEKKITAYHEAGHALVAASLPNTDPVHKISIISRGRAGGYTMKLPTEDKHYYSKDHFLDELAVSLGGYAAEEFIFGELTTGSSDDIRKATSIARSLVTRYGMSEKIGPVAWDDQSDMVFLGRDIGHEKKYSEEVASQVDTEVSRFMKEALVKAQTILKEKKGKLAEIAEYLLEHETIERDMFNKIMGISPAQAV